MNIQDTFKFHVPVEFEKGTDGSENGEMRLKGIASTAQKDRQGETLMPQGFDISYLKKAGYINWHHQLAKDPESIIGEPTSAKITKDGLYIEGLLYKDSEMAKKAYNLAKTLEKNSKTRRLGWSIEGKVLERDQADQSKVTKAKITGVALTPMPINANTYVSVMKAMVGGTGELFKAEEFEMDFLEDVQKAMTNETIAQHTGDLDANGGKTLNIKMPQGARVTIDKAGNVSITFNKDDEEETDDKAMTTTSAAAIIPESVEKKTKNVAGITESAEKKLLSKAELYEKLFTRYPELTIDDAKAVVGRIVENIEE